MRKSENIFQLIQSLSRSEKGYFKKFSSTHIKGEQNNYILLFDAIEKQKIYDDEALLKQFKEETFAKQLHRVKNYLYNQILKSLRAYHSQISTDGRLKEMLRNIEILYAKGLYKQCESILEKARQIAYKYEKLVRILELIDWERKLIPKEADSEKYSRQLMEIFYEREIILEKQKNLYEYELYYDRIYSLIKANNRARAEWEVETFEKILKSDVFKEEKKALSFNANILYWFCHSAYYFAMGELEKSYELVKKRRVLIESRPEFIYDSPTQYINVLSNLLTVQNSLFLRHSNLVSKAGFFADLQDLRSISSDSIEINARIFVNSYLHELGYYNNTGNFDAAIKLIPKIEKGLQTYGEKVNRVNQMVFYYYTSYAYFGGEKYQLALRWLNKLLNDTSVKLREDILCFARILNQMIHFELGNIELLEYATRSTYRFLYKKKKLYYHERLIIDFIRKNDFNALTESKEQVAAFSNLKEALLSGAEDSIEVNFDERHHFVHWLEGKIENPQGLKRIFRKTLKKQE